MKTQINTLLRGSHIKGIIGTNHNDRNEISKKVIAENPEKMTIILRDEKIELLANWSGSGKSVAYYGSISLELYKQFCGMIGVRQHNPHANITIHMDMTCWLTTNSRHRNSGKGFYNYISESEITII